MKKLLLLLVMILLSSCEITAPKTTALTILADRTDPAIAEPHIEDVLPLLTLEATSKMGVDLRFQNIGDVDYTPVYPLLLPVAGIFDNTLQRKSDITRFIASVDTLMAQQNRAEYYYQHSSILFSVVDHLVKLKEGNADFKYLILTSDLAEFSDLFDSYANMDIVLRDPDKVVSKLKSQLDIPNLREVILYIKYYPSTPSTNRSFKAWCRVYQSLFKESGLKIRIGIDKQIVAL